MSHNEHPFSPEELMAYADGQLTANRAELAAAHIATCAICAESVAGSLQLSRELTQWEVEEAPETLTTAVMAQLGQFTQEKRGRRELRAAWWGRNRLWAYGLTGSIAALFLVTVLTPSLLRSRQAAAELKGSSMMVGDHLDTAVPVASPALVERVDEDGSFDKAAPARGGNFSRPDGVERYAARAKSLGQSGQGQGSGRGQNGSGGTLGKLEVEESRYQPEAAKETRFIPQGQRPSEGPGPMIIRSVRLDIMTKNFDDARPRIEEIVRSASGYIEQLQTRGEIGSGRALSATLRLPANRLDSSLGDLRQLGQLRNESQNNSDVSSQYIDLAARLNNSHNTEQRLITLLRERTGNLKDVLEAERELARVREEIEQMDAQLKGLSKKVEFSSVQLELVEEFHAKIESRLPSKGTVLGNAAVDGYQVAVNTVIGVIAAILFYGPTFLILAFVAAPLTFAAWRMYKRRLNNA